MGEVPVGAPGEQLRVRLLGGLVVEGTTERALGSRKARTLLKALALGRGAPVSSALLAEAVWPGALPAHPDEQLGVLVSRLRRVLGRDRLVRGPAGYSLAMDWLDVDELAGLVATAEAALAERRGAAARAAADAARQLARGPLLPDDEGEWVETERTLADRLVGRAEAVAAAAALAAGDHASAGFAAEALLTRDPYDEVALRILMRAHVAAGRPASALAAYARARERLVQDLGVSPSVETEDLHTAILHEEPLGTSAAPARPARHDLIGRGAELAELERHYSAAALGPTRVVVVAGEAGIGKTALVDEFTRRLAERGTATLRGASDELGRDLPLQPVLDALAEVSAPPSAPVGDGGPAHRAAWYDLVLGAVQAAAVGGPGVLVLDDVHRADAATIGWLEWVVGRPAMVLVVATSRAPVHVAGVEVVTLGPLTRDELGELVGDRVAAAHLGAVHARSGGNPLFALAIASTAGAQLPDDVHTAVARALSALDSPTADAVRAAAVLGEEVDVDLVAAALAIPPAELIGMLETAQHVGLLTERGLGFGFRHDVVREALDAGTGAARRGFLHRAAANVLAARPRRDPLAIAVHARLGGADELAGTALVEAADLSWRRADVEAAELHLRAALDVGAGPPATIALARLLVAVGRTDEAAAAAADAVAAGGGAPALEMAGWVAYYQRDYAAAGRFADVAAGQAEPGTAEHHGALALAGRTRHGTGDLEGAGERLALASLGAARGVADAWRAHVELHRGNPPAAFEFAERALVDPDRHDHPFSPHHARWCRAVALATIGRVDAALDALDDAEEAAARAGSSGGRLLAPTHNVRAWVLRTIGAIDEADEHAHVAIAHESLGGDRPTGSLPEAYWVGQLELCAGRLAAGDLDSAAALLDAAAPIDVWDGTMAWHQRHRLGLLRARFARAAGNPDHAADLALAVLGDASARGAGRYAALAEAELALAGGPADPARIDGVLTRLEQCAVPEMWPIALALAERCGVAAWRVRAGDVAARLVAATPTARRRSATVAIDAAFSGTARW